MTLVKICGITSLEDALAATEAGADALGFNFFTGSSRYISPRDARRIIARLPPRVVSVGVFVNEKSPAAVLRAAEAGGVTAIQLHGDESPAFCRALRPHTVIKALRVGCEFDLEEVGEYTTETILLDAFSTAARGGTGQTFDWMIAARLRERVPNFFLAGGLTPGNVSEAIRIVRPHAVDTCSGVEDAPGRKSHTRMRNFIAAVRAPPQ